MSLKMRRAMIGLLMCCVMLPAMALPGDQLWTVQVGPNIGSTVAIDESNRRLYVGSASGKVSAVAIDTQTVLWDLDVGGYVGASCFVSG